MHRAELSLGGPSQLPPLCLCTDWRREDVHHGHRLRHEHLRGGAGHHPEGHHPPLQRHRGAQASGPEPGRGSTRVQSQRPVPGGGWWERSGGHQALPRPCSPPMPWAPRDLHALTASRQSWAPRQAWDWGCVLMQWRLEAPRCCRPHDGYKPGGGSSRHGEGSYGLVPWQSRGSGLSHPCLRSRIAGYLLP